MLMPTLNARSVFLCSLLLFALIPPARAQWAVIDAPAIVQLVQEVQTMQQQLATARSQLQSAQYTLQAMTGDRGMERLLSGTPRNYLPSNWTQVTSALQGSGSGAYAALSADVRSGVAANAVLSPQRMAAMSPAEQQQIQAARQWNAMQEALSHAALANASGRFSAIQSLIAAISTAGDQKASLDLQARIAAEMAMLQNEQTKLQVLSEAGQAQEVSLRQQLQERVIDGHGRFATRFQPTP
jgi:type IV secretion system protein VirB5